MADSPNPDKRTGRRPSFQELWERSQELKARREQYEFECGLINQHYADEADARNVESLRRLGRATGHKVYEKRARRYLEDHGYREPSRWARLSLRTRTCTDRGGR